MKILYSNILPMGLEDGQMSVADCFREQSERAYICYHRFGKPWSN